MKFPFAYRKDLAPLFLRIIFAIYLFLALKAKVYTASAHHKFAEELDKLGLPVPSFMAYLSIWSMLVCYFLIVIGWKTRWAAIPVIINFMVAIIAGHIIPGHGLSQMVSAIVLLLLGIFFLCNGPGRPSVDEGV